MTPNHITDEQKNTHVVAPMAKTAAQRNRFLVQKQHAALNIYARIGRLITLYETHYLYPVWVKWADLLTYIPDARFPYSRRNRPMPTAMAWQHRCEAVEEVAAYLGSQKSVLWRIANDPELDEYNEDDADWAEIAEVELLVLQLCDRFTAIWQNTDSAEVERIVAEWSSDAVRLPTFGKDADPRNKK